MRTDVLSEYTDACHLVEETEEDLRAIKAKLSEMAVDSVRGSNPEYPYEPRTFRIEGIGKEYWHGDEDIQRLEQILKQRRDNARKARIHVESWINTVPVRIQRIVRMKYFQRMTWDTVSARLGYKSGAAAHMELYRFLTENKK